MTNRLPGKIAIITGSGIGFAIAVACLREGARVFIADLGEARCREACEKLGEGAAPAPVDVSDPAAIEAMTTDVVKIAGRIDVLIACAGVFGAGEIAKTTPAEYDRVMAVNARGLFFTIAAASKAMVSGGGGGAIVVIASGAGRRGQPGTSPYAMSKAAAISLTQSAALELAPHRIRVNAIAPGSVATPMWAAVKANHVDPDIEAKMLALTPAGRMAQAEDMVGAALFLASDESAYVFGQTLNVDGGLFMN
jgi:D-sorbitol dehydrogenase (acceptor)